MEAWHEADGSILLLCALIALTLTLALTMPASAALIGITLADSPDILADPVSTTYLHEGDNTNPFTATGRAEQLDGAAITGGLFSLTALLTNAGGFAAGSFTVTGTIGTNGPSLLSGTLQNFGFSVEVDAVDFRFEVSGGDLAPLYGGIGATGGIVISQAGLPAGMTALWGARAWRRRWHGGDQSK
jgi:hypothetical protein